MKINKLQLAVVAYLVSLLLPFIARINTQTYGFDWLSGYAFLGSQPILLGLLLLSAILVFFLWKKGSQTWIRRLELILLLLFLYFYTLPFHIDISSSFFQDVWTVLQHGLGLGYYLSLSLLILTMTFYRFRKKR